LSRSLLMRRAHPRSTLFPYTTLFRSNVLQNLATGNGFNMRYRGPGTGTFPLPILVKFLAGAADPNLTASYNLAGNLFANTTVLGDRKSTRLNSSHVEISYAVFCLK